MKPGYLLYLYCVVIVKTVKLKRWTNPDSFTVVQFRSEFCSGYLWTVKLKKMSSSKLPQLFCHRSCTAATLTISGTREHFGYAEQDLPHTAVAEFSPRPVLVTRDHVRTTLLTWKQDTTNQHSGPCYCIIDAAVTRECFRAPELLSAVINLQQCTRPTREGI